MDGGAVGAFFSAFPVSDCFNAAAPRVKSDEIDPRRIDRETALAPLLAEPLLFRRPLQKHDGVCLSEGER